MKRLYRSRNNRKMGGVCGGIGEMLDVDPTIIRLLTIVMFLATGIIPVLLGYIIAWFIVPEGSQSDTGP
ncbi:MAG TPA: PspC domain-containing protein [Bacteroidetes bacterium]|nr:PspC domain-containing protein [Bacteroidota bacterium]